MNSTNENSPQPPGIPELTAEAIAKLDSILLAEYGVSVYEFELASLTAWRLVNSERRANIFRVFFAQMATEALSRGVPPHIFYSVLLEMRTIINALIETHESKLRPAGEDPTTHECEPFRRFLDTPPDAVQRAHAGEAIERIRYWPNSARWYAMRQDRNLVTPIAFCPFCGAQLYPTCAP